MTTPQEDFEKDYATLKNIMRGAKCFHALRALEFAEQYHSGYRKDDITPNFHHQVRIAFTLYDERERIEAAGLNLDEIIAEGILHDTYEDNQSLQLSVLDGKFNERITTVTTVLSKVRGDRKIPIPEYYEELLEYPEAIIVKLHDRRNNVETIHALPPKRQVGYIIETRQLIALAKRARDRYPKLEGLIQHSRKQLSSYLNIYLGFARMIKRGKAAEVMPLLESARLLSEPSALRPNLKHDRTRRPAAP